MKEDTSSNLRQVIPWTQFTGKMILPLFLIIVFCSMTYNSHAQDTRLNLKLENSTLLDAIKQISTITGMEFFTMQDKSMLMTNAFPRNSQTPH